MTFTLNTLGDRSRGQTANSRTISGSDQIESVILDQLTGKPDLRRGLWLSMPAEQDRPSGEELLDEPALPGGATFNYQLLTCTWNVQMDSIVGKVTEGHFRGMVRSTIGHYVEQFNRVRGGEWAPVAVRSSWATKSRRGRHQRPDRISEDDYFNTPETQQAAEARSKLQRTEYKREDVEAIELTFAFADLSRGRPIDPLQLQQPGHVGGAQAKFASDMLLSSMSARDRADRALAKEIVGEFYGLKVDTRLLLPEAVEARVKEYLKYGGVLTDEEIATLAKVQPAQVAYVRDNLPKPRASKKTGEKGPSADA